MPADPTTHPAPETLRAYGLGTLDDAATDAVEQHVADCETCLVVVTGGPADDLARLVADAGRPPSFPGYEVTRELGRGGMGVVYLARNTMLARDEVLKVVNRDLLARPGAAERFLREIQSAARLHHANVVTAYAALRADDLIAFAMEYVPGPDLGQLVKARGPLPVAEAVGYAVQAALGLQHAHERGMVHRDIKPSNLILATADGKPVVKVLDFGLAKATQADGAGGTDPGLTGAGHTLGTPETIAPEQIADAATADIRADVYALGCTLYHLLAGRPPFAGRDVEEVLRHHTTTPAPDLTAARPDAPAGLAAVVAKMMAKHPAERYQTPAAAAAALRPFAEPPRRRVARKFLAAAVLAAALLTAAAGYKLSLTTADGTLVVESNEPDAVVVIDGEAVTLTGSDGKPVSIRVKPGTHRVEVRKDGFTAAGDVVTIESGKDRKLTARLEKPPPPAPPPPVLPPPLPPTPPATRRAFRSRTGEWKFEGDQLVQTTLADNCELVFGDFGWTDYDFTATAFSATDMNDFALLYRVSGSGGGRFGHGANNTQLHAQSVLRGQVTPLAQTDRRFEMNTWYALKVELRGRHVRCFVGGELVHEFDDDRHPRGAVGLRAHHTATRFRDVRVTDPAGRSLFDWPALLPAFDDQYPPPTDPPAAAELRRLVGTKVPVAAVAFSPEGTKVFAAGNGEHLMYWGKGGYTIRGGQAGSAVRLWDAGSGAMVDDMNNHGRKSPWSYQMLVAAKNTPIILFGHKDRGVSVIDYAGAKLADAVPLLGEFKVPDKRNGITALSLTPDGRRAFALALDGSTWVWDVRTPRLIQSEVRLLEGGTCAAISPGGRYGLVGRPKKTFAEFELTTGKETGRWKEAADAVTCVTYSPDGNRVLTGEVNGSVGLWDAASGKCVHRFPPTGRPVRAVAFSADGRRALSGGGDQVVRLWDLVEKKELAAFPGHTGAVLSVAFAPDGGRAASGSADYTVRLWRLPP